MHLLNTKFSGCFLFLLLYSINSISYSANPEFGAQGFDMPDFDVTSGVESTNTNDKKLKQTLSYDVAQNKDNKTVTNRIGWRLQWDDFIGKDNYVVVDAKVRTFNDKDSQHDSNEELDYDAKINALYVQRSDEQQSLTVGYQTISLGVMDMLGYMDVINPWDYSESALTAPEDARIGQPLVKWSLFGDQQWDMMVNFYPSEHRYPLVGLDDTLSKILGTTDYSIQDGLPELLEEPELIIRTRIINGKHEQQWLAGSLLQNDPALKRIGLSGTTLIIERTYPRYELFGGGYNFTTGNHQWRLEASWKNNIQPLDAFGYKLDETSFGLGWEYSANGDYNLAVEFGRRWRNIQGGTSIVSASLVNKRIDQLSARWNKRFLHETINVTLFASRIDPEPVNLYSVSISYTPVDNWVIELLSTHIETDNNSYSVFTSSTGLNMKYYW